MGENENHTPSFSDQMMRESGLFEPDELPKTAAAPPEKKPEAAAEVKTDDKTEDKAEDKAAAGTTPPAKPEGTTEDTAAAAAAAEVKTPDIKPEGAAADDIDMDETRLLALLSKKTGREIKSLDELKAPGVPETTEQAAARAEEQRSAAIEFGKANKMFTQSDYDRYVKFSALSPLEVVKADFIQKAKAADPEITAEDSSDLFNECYNLFEDEQSFKYKHSQALITEQYEQLQRKNFAPILDVTQTYDQVQKDQVKATAFKTSIEDLFGPKLPTRFDFVIDGENISYPVDLKDKKIADMVSTIKADYLTYEMMTSTLDQTGKVDEASLRDLISKDLQIAMLQQMVTEVAKSYSDIRLTKAKMGRRGAIDLSEETSGKGTANTKILGESDRLLRESFPDYVGAAGVIAKK